MAEYPTVVLLHGDDAPGLNDRAKAVLPTLGIDEVNEFNFQRFDGERASISDVRAAAYTLPFFTPRRAVILHNPQVLARAEAGRAAMIELLDNLPETTTLVLVQLDEYQPYGRDKGWKNLRESGGRGAKGETIVGWVTKHAERAKYEVVKLPDVREMNRWIIAEGKRQGGVISDSAAVLLTSIIGNDTGQARMEVTKLLNYVDLSRPVTAEDVRLLTPEGGQASVFTLADHIAAGDSKKALAELGKLLRESDPNEIFPMVIRQFRLLLLAKEAWQKGVRSKYDASTLLGVAVFPAEKALEQSKRFSMEQLEYWYRSLLELDRQNKSSEADLLVGLQTLIARIGFKEAA